MGKLKPHRHEDERESHPAFGVISLHRVSAGGDGAVLVGSSVRHHHHVMLEIHEAERSRALHSERYYSHKLLARVALSPVQLSEMLTGINTMGVPCTLRYYRGADGKLVNAGDPPETAKAQKTANEFDAQVKKATEKIRAMQARLRYLAEKGKPVGKRALEQLAMDMGCAAQEIDSNMPFIQERFADACEETVRDAKGEIEAFIGAKVDATGLKAIREQAPEMKLLEDVEIADE